MAPPSIFYESVAQQGSPVPGSPISFDPELNLTGLPGLGGPQGMLLQMILQPLLQQMLNPARPDGSRPFVPAPFAPTHNLFDQYRRRAEFQQMQSSLTGAQEHDRQTMLQFIRGMGAMRGIAWTPEREQAAQVWANDANLMAPTLAQGMPALFDRMMGSRGSSMVMAQSIFSGGRYQIDPVTQTMGLSSQSASAMTNQIFERLYGPGADLAAMRGIGAGSAGMMFDELTRRGHMPGALSRDEQIRGIADRQLRDRGLGDGDVRREIGGVMDDLRRLDNPQLEARIRSFEAGRAVNHLRNMSGAISAMRDIFGDMGHPDAPIPVLIEGLNALTQGGLATTTPARLESMARDFANSARRSPIGIERAIAMAAANSNQAEAMGLDRSAGVAATQHAVNFSLAYASMSGTPTWGRADAQRMAAIDSRLMLNARASPVANQLGATIGLERDVGFRAGSEAEAMSRAIRAGEQTYSHGGQTRSVYDRDRWRDIMVAGGVDSRLASGYRSDTAANQRNISELRLDDLSRGLQASVDTAPRVQQAYRIGARRAGETNEFRIRQIEQFAAEGLLQLNGQDGLGEGQISSPEAMAQYLARRMGTDVNDANAMRQLRLVSASGWRSWEQSASRTGYRTGDQAIMAQRQSILRRGGFNLLEAQGDTAIQTALSPLGGDWLRRLVDQVSAATPGMTMSQIVAQGGLGWFPTGEVGTALEDTVRRFNEQVQAYGVPDAVIRQAAELQQQIANPGRGGFRSFRATNTLQGLADQYTGGDVQALVRGGNDVRAAIRRRALEQMRQMTPGLVNQADAAGVGRGPTAGAMEAANELREIAEMRGTTVPNLVRDTANAPAVIRDRVLRLRERMEAGRLGEDQIPSGATPPGAGAPGVPQQISMSGTLTIPGLGTGRVAARGQGGPATT